MAKAAKRREANEAAGLHVPVFLIASIAAECNLRCTGCYAWANGNILGINPSSVASFANIPF